MNCSTTHTSKQMVMFSLFRSPRHGTLWRRAERQSGRSETRNSRPADRPADRLEGSWAERFADREGREGGKGEEEEEEEKR